MEDAIYYAENGYKILPGSRTTNDCKDQIEKFDGTKIFLDENGENFSSGELVV